MRAVPSAITAAFKNAFNAAATLLSWPLRALLGVRPGPSCEPIPEIAPAPEEIFVQIDHTELYRRTAVSLQAWAAESLLADGASRCRRRGLCR